MKYETFFFKKIVSADSEELSDELSYIMNGLAKLSDSGRNKFSEADKAELVNMMNRLAKRGYRGRNSIHKWK